MNPPKKNKRTPRQQQKTEPLTQKETQILGDGIVRYRDVDHSMINMVKGVSNAVKDDGFIIIGAWQC
jgi:hypothetical protein